MHELASRSDPATPSVNRLCRRQKQVSGKPHCQMTTSIFRSTIPQPAAANSRPSGENAILLTCCRPLSKTNNSWPLAAFHNLIRPFFVAPASVVPSGRRFFTNLPTWSGTSATNLNFRGPFPRRAPDDELCRRFSETLRQTGVRREKTCCPIDRCRGCVHSQICRSPFQGSRSTVTPKHGPITEMPEKKAASSPCCSSCTSVNDPPVQRTETCHFRWVLPHSRS